MTREQILDSYFLTGDAVPDFRGALAEIDDATRIVQVETQDFRLLSLDRIDEDEGIAYFMVYDFEQSVRKDPPQEGKLYIVQLKELLGEEGYSEFIQSTRFLLHHKKDMYIPSRNAFSGLAARAELSGCGTSDPTHELFALLCRRYERDPQRARMVVRLGDRVNKLIACMSDKYAYVPQSLVCEILDGFAVDMDCEPVCTGWEISQFYTSINFEFPERGNDFAKTYNLTKTIIPGICLHTSDSGDSSFTALGFYRIQGSSRKVYINEFRRKHTGRVNPTELRKCIKERVFDQYISLPQRLCELIGIPVPYPREVTELILDEIDFHKEAGKRKGKGLMEAVISEYSDSFPYTAYDVAMAILSIPERFKDGANSTLRKIESVVAQAVYADYEKANRQAESIAILPDEDSKAA